MTAVEFKVRSVSTAAASFAVILDFIKLGMAMAAMIKMMVTTISNSISEKPFRFFLRAIMLPPVPACKYSRRTKREEHKSKLHLRHRRGEIWPARYHLAKRHSTTEV